MSLTIESLKSTSPLFQYTDNDLQEILKEHGKTLENILEYVIIIRDWLKTQPHLPAQPSERQIASFVVNNKFLIEKTKRKIDMSYTIRSLIPEFYKDIFPKSKSVENFYKYMDAVCLPKLTKDLNRVIIINFKPGNDVLNAETVIAMCFMFMEMTTLVDFCRGYEFIFDATHMSFAFGSTYTPMVIKKGIQVLEHVFSGRLGALYIINVPSILTFLIGIFTSLLKSKLGNRLDFLEGYSRLKELYDEDVIPSDFGGKGDSLENLKVQYRNMLESYNDYYENLQTLKVDESLRPEKLQNDEFLGYHGHFKQINVD